MHSRSGGGITEEAWKAFDEKFIGYIQEKNELHSRFLLNRYD